MLIYSQLREDLALRTCLAARVLVIDDEALIRWSLCEALTADGIDAGPAATLADVRRLAAESPAPRVALLDRRFSGASERLLMATILASAPECQFLVMTTSCDDSFFAALTRGAALVQKPFDLRRIVAHVHALLGTHHVGPTSQRAQEYLKRRPGVQHSGFCRRSDLMSGFEKVNQMP